MLIWVFFVLFLVDYSCAYLNAGMIDAILNESSFVNELSGI